MSNSAKKPKRANDSGCAVDSLFAHLKPIVDNPRVYNALVKKNHYYASGVARNVRCELCLKLVLDNESYYSSDELPTTDLCTNCFKLMKTLAAPREAEVAISAPTNLMSHGAIDLAFASSGSVGANGNPQIGARSLAK